MAAANGHMPAGRGCCEQFALDILLDGFDRLRQQALTSAPPATARPPPQAMCAGTEHHKRLARDRDGAGHISGNEPLAGASSAPCHQRRFPGLCIELQFVRFRCHALPSFESDPTHLRQTAGRAAGIPYAFFSQACVGAPQEMCR